MLLILAGITINALTGSNSAPAKANEAEQQNDIGSAKDQIALTATNAKLLAYDTAYVGNGISSIEVSNSVGRAVIKAVAEQIQTNNQVGKATIAITGYGTLDNINNNATIKITTRDFIVEGTITFKEGILTWGEIEENKPGIELNVSSPLTIYEGDEQDVTATLKQFTADTVTWTSSDDTKVTVTAKTDSKQATIKGKAKTTQNVTITASAGGYSATIEVKVEEVELISSKKGQGVLSKLTDANPHSTKLKDAKGNKMVVPAGFEISSSNGDAANVAEGIIIEDGNKDANGKGNQFVWVPIGKITKANGTSVTIPLGRYKTFTGTPSPKQDASNGYVITTSSHKIDCYYTFLKYCYEFYDNNSNPESSNSTNIGATDAAITYGNTKAKNIKEFVESALANKGFYIARYEAGIEGTTQSTTDGTYSISGSNFSTNGLTTDNLTTYVGKLTSKSGKGVWNKINQPNAATLCQNMYTSTTNQYVTSDLVNSYAWDTAIIFIQQCGQDSSYASRTVQSTDSSKPAATGENTSSGTSALDVQCNIYDMAGNVEEWTTESYADGSLPCVFRGGSYYETYPTEFRLMSSTSWAEKYLGFRPILYLPI